MAKNSLCFIFTFLFVQISLAQTNRQWKGYFSYSNVTDLAQSATTLFASSENALFSRNAKTSETNTLNTVDGLSGQTITCLYYSPVFKKSLVGYENGLITIINETDKSMVKIVDIINKQLPEGLKKINHFLEHDGIVYVSCDFGIVQFNLSSLFFGDTFFIGNSGAEIKVNKTIIDQGFIYAATNEGIKKAELSSRNLVDFKRWPSIAAGNWFDIAVFNNQIFAVNSSGNIHKYNTSSNSFTSFLQLPQATKDMRVSGDYMLVTTANTVYVYAQQMQPVSQIINNQISESTLNFTCATIIDNQVFIGTNEMGVYSTKLSSSSFENITPSGPLRNSIFALQSNSNVLWAVYGDYDDAYNPYPKDEYGISKFSKSGWLNIPYEKVLGAKSLIRVAISPTNENIVYIGSADTGLLKIQNDVPTVLYGTTNSQIEAIAGTNDAWINGLVFDKTGNLWMNNSQLDKTIKVLKADDSWQSYSIKSIIANPKQTTCGRMSIDKNGTKWLATNDNGIIGFNEKDSVFKKITIGADSGNLPTADARVAIQDNNNQLWIGTSAGLRVLSNVDDFLKNTQLTTKPIIILENDLAQELMFTQFITDISVDGANNKWIGTTDSGIFLVSPNGQETKYHFTINNSPLPSNSIIDIEIDGQSGEVFIATTKGMVSFKGISTEANQDLKNVFIYPNPVRPDYDGTVKISGLLNKANVKVTDIEGNLVFETTSEGGTVEWDTKAFGKHKVASGVYMIFISAKDGIESKVKKVMIIR
jgi:hypothetical protein